MKYLKVFVDFLEIIDPLDDDEKGRLFTGMLRYADTREMPTFHTNEKYVWPVAKQNIDREYDFISKQSENGKLGGRPKKPNVTHKSQKDNDNDNDNDNDTDNDNDNESSHVCHQENNDKNVVRDDSMFESFWYRYPQKIAKQDARTAWSKLGVDDALYARIMQGLSLQKNSKQWMQNNGQYIPYAHKWLAGKRWEDEVDPAADFPQFKKLILKE